MHLYVIYLMIPDLPEEMIRHVYSFLNNTCNCCLRTFSHPNEIKHSLKYNVRWDKQIIHHYCSDDCFRFLI